MHTITKWLVRSVSSVFFGREYAPAVLFIVAMIAVVLFLVILGPGFIKASKDLVNFDRVEHDNFFIAVHNPVVLFKFFL